MQAEGLQNCYVWHHEWIHALVVIVQYLQLMQQTIATLHPDCCCQEYPIGGMKPNGIAVHVLASHLSELTCVHTFLSA